MQEVCAEVQESQAWVERVVMGLNLCPFARPVKASIRYVHTDADALGLYDAALKPELDLMAADAERQNQTERAGYIRELRESVYIDTSDQG